MEKREIYKKLKYYKNELDKDYDVLFMGLKGSQNYNLATEDSDVDVIAVVKPRKYARSAISCKVSFGSDNKDEAQVCDLFEFAKQVRKGNCSYIEVINSDYKIGKLPEAFYEAQTKVNSHYHMMIQKYKALDKEFASKKALIDKYGYDPKQLHHIVRLRLLLEEYVAGTRKANDVKVKNKEDVEYLIDLKTTPIDNFRELADFNLHLAEEYYKQLPDFVENEISDEYLYSYLDDLNEDIYLSKVANVVSNTYELLKNEQYLEKSYKQLTKELNCHFGLDIERIEVKAKTIKANTPTDNYDMLHNVYSDFLDLFTKHCTMKIQKLRPNLTKEECKDLIENYNMRVIDERDIEFLYSDSALNDAFVNFTMKYQDILKETPGFYQKLNTETNTWYWKVAIQEGILIPNKVNGQIRNIQIRTNDEGKSKYYNLSSSKKTGPFYKYATKAHVGHCLFEQSGHFKDLIITEGFFKGYSTFVNHDEVKQLFASQGIELSDKYDVLAAPGISIKITSDMIKNYNNVILAFDRDCIIGKNKEAKRQYEKLQNKVKALVGTNFNEYLPDLKIDDDIYNLNK